MLERTSLLSRFVRSSWLRRFALVGAVAGFASLGTCAYLKSQIPAIPEPGAEPLGGIPDHVVFAFLAAEDQRFFDHAGIDGLAVGRAVVNNVAGGPLQGGSTITQQTAKLMLIEAEPERSLRRKVREAALAHELEKRLTKEAILQVYLDTVYFGEGTWGIEDAAALYYGRPAADLSLGQAAMLAGLPMRPADLNPIANPEAAIERRSYVLARMADLGWITPGEQASAEVEPVLWMR